MNEHQDLICPSDDGTTSNYTPKKIILVIGSIGIDRLLSVQQYPLPDSKVRTTSYHEVGGGNAANTAATIGKLSKARIFQDFVSEENDSSRKHNNNQNIGVQFLGKVGRDAIGDQLVRELHESNVDTSSLLFCRGPAESTTSFCTILVDEAEHTRTCFFTPGTAGNLTLNDVYDNLKSKNSMDKIFRNVVHLHSDARLTEVSLELAMQAKELGISISVDCEKDRSSPSLDALLDLCDILFTNSSCLEAHIQRLTKDREREHGRCELPTPTIRLESSVADSLDQTTVDILVRALPLNSYFARWQIPMKKEVIITQGSLGSLNFRPIQEKQETVEFRALATVDNKVIIASSMDPSSNSICFHYSFCDKRVNVQIEYEVHFVGVLQNVKIVDTTGAGDAFIGGYLLSKVGMKDDRRDPRERIRFQLEFGTFVSGKKLEGPGARTALPTGNEIDTKLGTSIRTVAKSLSAEIGSFNAAT